LRGFIVPRNNARVCDGLLSNQRETTYAHEKRATSRRELIEPTKGDKRYVRRNAKGEFNKVVDVGKSLSSDKRTTAKKKVPKGQGDRGDTKG
jgi:hypothetical protein